MEEKEKHEEHKDRSKALEGDVDSVRDFPEETLCPSCGKFVGAYEKCPYCGAVLKKRMALAIFKRGCLVMSVVGLIALWYAAVKMEPKLITIGEIGPTYNKGIFRVEGTVEKVNINPDTRRISIGISDGTGNINLTSYDFEKLERLGKLHNNGDEVGDIGEVGLSVGFSPSIGLKAVDRMKLVRKEVMTAKIGDIDDEDIGNMYVIYGEVVSTKEFKRGTTLILGDETGLIEITLFGYVLEQIPGPEALLKPGTEVEMVTLIGAYQDELQVKPRSPQEVTISEEDRIATAKIPKKKEKKGYEKVTIGSLKAADEGKKVEVKGKISDKSDFAAGTKFNLSDGTGAISVTLFNSSFADYPQRAAVVRDGSEVIIFSKVGVYQGQLQLKPKDHSDLELVAAPAPPKKKEEAKPAPTKAVKKPTPKPAAPKPEPTKPAPPAKPAAEVKAEAAAEKPEKKPEPAKPVPAPAEKKPEAPKPAPVKEEPKAEAPTKPAITFTSMKIGDIVPGKEGQFVEIKGEVVGSREFSKGLKLQVKDDSGTIDVVLWTNLLDKLADKDKITMDGAKISVKGKVGSFRDEMQITPKYPNQIKLAE